ncbi:MAG TPA: hypothetical protein VD998_00725 [Verrucomicrobiae bacterium]|nr:hypothetical protein [Verrucomicrobiae bacterium]
MKNLKQGIVWVEGDQLLLVLNLALLRAGGSDEDIVYLINEAPDLEEVLRNIAELIVASRRKAKG